MQQPPWTGWVSSTALSQAGSGWVPSPTLPQARGGGRECSLLLVRGGTLGAALCIRLVGGACSRPP